MTGDPPGERERLHRGRARRTLRRQPAHRRRRSRLTWRGRIVVGVVSLLVLAGIGAGGLYAYAQYRFHQIHREAVAGLAPIRPVAHRGGDAPYTVLMVGDNCRYCLSEKTTFGPSSEIAGGRSDVTMLLRVDPATDRVSILSIPRDLWLPIPGGDGEIRVDAALNQGPGELVTTIEDDLDIPINHYVELNFDTFQDVVNAIGGLDMDFPQRTYDAYSKLNVPAGCYHLNGFQALEVVRARHLYYQVDGQWNYDGLGDISRIQRDHEFLRVLATALDAQGLGDPGTDNDLIGVAAKDVTIDNRFTLSSLVDLASTLSDVNLAKSPERTLPVDEDLSPDGFVFDGAQYGDVVFPTFVREQSVITQFEGASLPVTASAAVPVRVENGSGTNGEASGVAQQLGARGFPVASVGSEQVRSSPSESVVYYGAGHEAAAQGLADVFDGAVALGYDPALAGTGLTLVAGSNLVIQTPAPTASTAPSGAATAAAGSSPAAATPAASRPKAAVIGGITASNPKYPGFDPRACPAGVQARALPTLPIPSPEVLPET